MTDQSHRFNLPLLAAGQAQKEITHNEAITLADILLHPVVVAVGPAIVPPAPNQGACWIVGNAPTGQWAGQAGAIAGWTAGGWRFVAPVEGMTVWSVTDSLFWQRLGSGWVSGVISANMIKIAGNQVVGPRTTGIAVASGGSVIDGEARVAIAAIIGALRSHGLIAV